MFGFEKLDVWQRAISFANELYLATEKFPPDERFGLTNQLRRSAVSIAANVAEGSSRSSTRDFSRFVEISYGSLMETVSHLRIAKIRGYLSIDTHDGLYSEAEELGKMLSGLKSRLLKDRD